MFQRFHAMKEREEGGFTLIELLVVILIIAILAAIAIPVFLNQRKKGWVAQEQSSLKNAATAMETYGTDHNGSFAGVTVADLTANGYNNTQDVTITLTAAKQTTTGYCIDATHALLPAGDTWKTAHYASTDGTPLAGACP
jgi:type IV pilus assembly protein PilA